MKPSLLIILFTAIVFQIAGLLKNHDSGFIIGIIFFCTFLIMANQERLMK